jgi:hypothetical protein
MAKTIQKKIKFSKGQIVPELVERTDLELFDSSAQEMKNVVSTVYGGVRSRSGTKYIDTITGLNEAEPLEITSDVFTDTSGFLDNEYSTVETVGENRVLAKLDFGEGRDGYARITVKNISVLPYFVELKEAGTYTKTIPHGLYEITVVGAGGGGAAAGDGPRDYKACEAGGGSGSCVVATHYLKDGQYLATVGAGGVGASCLYSSCSASAGSLSSFADLISCPGGGGGIARWTDHSNGNPTAGSGGRLPTVSDLVKTSVLESGKSGATHGGAGTANGGKNSLGYGTGGRGYSAGYTSIGYNGENGYIKYQMLDTDMNIVISGSDDDSSYTEIATETITTGVRDIEVELSYRYRYVKFEISTTETNLPSGVSFQYIREDVSSFGDVVSAKLVPFVYNNTDKYLFVVADEQIQVFKDDVLLSVIKATGIKKDYLPNIKTAQKDDTIVFTHEDMPPKILKRTGVDEFTFSDLELKDIPYSLFGEEIEETKSVGITPSDMEGAIKITAESSVFTKDYIGQYIDGNGGRVRITEYVSGTVVNGSTVIPFYTKDKISSWKFLKGYDKVWSETRGYPRTCLFAQQRLWFGGSKSKPSTVWASRLGDYFNFKNSGNYDNDSIDVDLLTNDVIMNIVDNRGVHIFTSGQEITSAEGSYTPDKISFTVNTRNGSVGKIKPVILTGNVLYVEKNGKSLLNYVYNDSQAAYVSDNVSILSNLLDSPVSMDAEANSSQDKGDFLYVVLEDGRMVVGCLVLSQDIRSLCMYETSGQIKDVCCLLDQTYILVERKGYTCLEKFVPETLCDSVEQRYITSETINGLYRHRDSVVYVWSDKRVYGRFVVNGSSVNLPVVPNEYCYIGLAFDFNIQGNPIAIGGKTTTIKKRITSADVCCKDTPVLVFCGQKKEGKDNYKYHMCTKYDNDARYNISGEFYPFKVLSVQLNINYEG